MATTQLNLYICEHYFEEFKNVLEILDFEDVTLHPFLPVCQNKNPKIILDLNYKMTQHEYVLNVCPRANEMLNKLNSTKNTVHDDPLLYCFEHVIDRSMIEYFIMNHAYLITNGWLKDWRNNIYEQGFNQKNLARKFYADSCDKLVFLDTGVSDLSLEIQSLSEFLEIPYEHIQIGLSHLQDYLTAIVLNWRIKHSAENKKIENLKNRVATQFMINQYLEKSVAFQSKDDLIQLTKEAMTTLFGVTTVTFTPKDALDYIKLNKKLDSKEIYSNPKTNEMLVKVIRLDKTLGILSIHGFLLPDRIPEYQSFILNLVHIFSLILTNINQQEEILNSHLQIIQQAKMIGIGQLAAGVAHEINTPLGYIMSNLDFLKNYNLDLQEIIHHYELYLAENKVEEQLPKSLLSKKEFIIEESESIFEECLYGLNSIKNIVTTLLKITDKEPNLLNEHLNIHDSIKSLYSLISKEIETVADITFVLNPIPTLQINSSDMNQILLNLTLNAYEAIKEQNDSDKGIIKFETEATHSFVIISIEDSGIGIHSNIRDRVFEPFFSTKNVGDGMGIGLSVVYNLVVKKYNGEISLENSVLGGTRAVIKFPIEH